MDPDAKRRAEQLAEARALQSSVKASGSHRGENSPGGRGGSKGRSRGGGSGGGRGGRGGRGRGGYHNVASDYGPPPSRRPQPSPLARPPPGVPPQVAFGGSRQSSATRPAPTRTQVPAAPMFAPDPVFASALGAARPATAQAPTKAPTQVASLTPAQVRDQFAAIVGGQAAPKVPAQAAPKILAQHVTKTPVQVAAMAPAQVDTKVAAQVASKASAQVAPMAPAQVAPMAPAQVAPMAPVQVPAQVSAKIDAEGRERCDRIATKLAAVIDAQVAPMVPVQNTPYLDAADMADQEMKRISRGPLKPPAVRGIPQVPEQPTSFHGHNGVSNSRVKPSAAPDNDRGSVTQAKIPPVHSCIEHAPSITGSLPGPRSTEAPVRAESSRPIATSRKVTAGAPVVIYYQDEPPRPVVKRSAASSDATAGRLHQQEEPPRPKPKDNTPAAPGNSLFKGYYQGNDFRVPVASSDAKATTLHQQEPPRPNPKDNTPAAAVNRTFNGYYQDDDFLAKLPVISSGATGRTLHPQESPRLKPKNNTVAAAVNRTLNGYYQDDDFLAKLPVTSSETPTIASYQNGTHHANVNSPSDMMDTTPDEPRTIPANQSDNILQSLVVRSSDTKIQPRKIYHPDDYDLPSAGGRASGADLMDVDEEPAIGGYHVLETANMQQAKGKKCTCSKKTTAGLGTSRWAAPAVKETDPISVTCPVHHPRLRVALLTPTTPSLPPTASSLSPTASSLPPTASSLSPTALSFSPTALSFSPTALSFSPTTSSLSPTASSFVPRSENSYNPPGDFQAASASTENVLNGHTNDDTSGSVRPSRLPGFNLPWFL